MEIAVILIRNIGDMFVLHGYTYKPNGKEVKVSPTISYTTHGYQSKDSIDGNEHMERVEPTGFFTYLCMRQKDSLEKALDKLPDLNVSHYYVVIEESDRFVFEKSKFYKANFDDTTTNILLSEEDLNEPYDHGYSVLSTFLYLEETVAFQTKKDKDFYLYSFFEHRNIWKYKAKRPDLLMHPKLMLTKDPLVYYQTAIKEVSKIGTKSNEAPYSVVISKEPNELIETLRKRLDFSYLSIVHLPTLYKSFPSFMLMAVGSLGIAITHRQRNKIKVKDKREKLVCVGDISELPEHRSKIIYTVENVAIAENIYPMHMANRSQEIFTYMHRILEEYLAGKTTHEVVDITDRIYTDGKLHEDIAMKTLSIDITLSLPDREKNAKLMLGTSLPSRNVLKRLEKKSPVVKLLIDTENEHRYYSVTDTTEGSVIMSEYYCDIIL